MEIHFVVGRAPKQPAAERRQTILAGAERVFAHRSYARAGTAVLAREAGVKPAALYRYFPGKRALYLATLEHAGQRLLHLWQERVAQADNAVAALWGVGMDYFAHVESRAPAMRLWLQALGEDGDAELRGAAAGPFREAVDLLERLLRAGQAEGTVRPDLDTRLGAWEFMAIGLAFDVAGLVGPDAGVDRPRAEAWGRRYLESVRAPGTPLPVAALAVRNDSPLVQED
ncbi:MAG: TetR/AcrR family transcriptional regulator [Dehalococcoidia bacterium]|nr:TetR/AcrR family transcriptional regulator [Dehalococcoidia bacterium]